jgi:hypothetical protein
MQFMSHKRKVGDLVLPRTSCLFKFLNKNWIIKYKTFLHKVQKVWISETKKMILGVMSLILQRNNQHQKGPSTQIIIGFNNISLREWLQGRKQEVYSFC